MQVLCILTLPCGKARTMSETSKVNSIIARALQAHSPNTSHKPEPEHRKAKAAFWSYYFSSGDIPPTQIDAATAARHSGYNEVISWWTLEGFPEWFSNGEEFRQRIEYVSNLSLDVLEQLLLDRNAPVREQLAAAKIALEIAGKFPQGAGKGQDKGKGIDGMDKDELRKFVDEQMAVRASRNTNS